MWCVEKAARARARPPPPQASRPGAKQPSGKLRRMFSGVRVGSLTTSCKTIPPQAASKPLLLLYLGSKRGYGNAFS
jgi:hypothetical protein